MYFAVQSWSTLYIGRQGQFLLDTAMVRFFFFFCACRLMRPLSKVETRRDSSSHNFVENMVNIIPYQIAWCVS